MFFFPFTCVCMSTYVYVSIYMCVYVCICICLCVSYGVVPCRTVSYGVVAIRHLVRHRTTRRKIPPRRAPTPRKTPQCVVQCISDSTLHIRSGLQRVHLWPVGVWACVMPLAHGVTAQPLYSPAPKTHVPFDCLLLQPQRGSPFPGPLCGLSVGGRWDAIPEQPTARRARTSQRTSRWSIASAFGPLQWPAEC